MTRHPTPMADGLSAMLDAITAIAASPTHSALALLVIGVAGLAAIARVMP